MGFVRNVICVLALSPMTGCVVTTEFYRPEASGGQVVPAHCPPVHSFVLFEHAGTTIAVQAWTTEPGVLRVIMALEIPSRVSARLLAPDVAVVAAAGSGSRAAFRGSRWVSAWRTAPFPWNAELAGQTEERFWEQVTLYGTTERAYYVFTAMLRLPDSPGFSLRLPALEFNGERWEPPVVDFRRATEKWFTAGNC